MILRITAFGSIPARTFRGQLIGCAANLALAEVDVNHINHFASPKYINDIQVVIWCDISLQNDQIVQKCRLI